MWSLNFILAYFVALIFFVHGSSLDDVVIVDSSRNFELSYRGVLVFNHSREETLVTVGRGIFQADEHLGNFELSDILDEKFDLTEWKIETFESEIRITLSRSDSSEHGIVFIVTVSSTDKLEIRFDFEAFSNEGINRFIVRFPSTEDERIWGGGEQFTFLNLREGQHYPLWVREQGVGRNKSSLLTQIMDLDKAGGDYHTTYWPQPSFLSSRGYHFEMNFPTYSELNLAPMNSRDGHSILWHHSHVPGAPCPHCKMVFTVENTLMEIVQAVNPGQPPVPDWVLKGAIIGVQGGTEAMLNVLNQALEAGVAVSALWIQDWSGKIVTLFGKRVFWNWKWNEEWYPNLDTTIVDLKNAGIRVTGYINPHFNIEGDIYQENKETGYWLSINETGENLIQNFGQFESVTVDLTSPEDSSDNEARTWYKELIKRNMIQFGFAGWMADFGEYSPLNARSGYPAQWWGKDHGEIVHQSLSQDWASLNREAVEETGNVGEILVWMRSGGIKSRDHQLMTWAGDQTVDWTASDGLKSSIVASLSLAVSGMGLCHSDIGGYTTVFQLGVVRSKELLLRWAEYSVFTPVMRTHEGNQPDRNHQIYSDADTLQKFGRLTQIFASLFNYSKATVDQNAIDRKPVMRPLFLVFEEDTRCHDIAYQYMYGDDILVAPVTEPDVDTWNVYLPAGEDWVWLWNPLPEPEAFAGGQEVIVEAPIGKPPAFYRKSSKWVNLFQDIAGKFEAV